MKALLALPILVLGLTAFAQPSEQPEFLSPVANAKVVVSGGGGLAAVQPIAILTVTVNSCLKRDLSVETKKEGNTVFVKVLDSSNVDCLAIGQDREYSLQVSSDATMESYVLLNPIQVTYER